MKNKHSIYAYFTILLWGTSSITIRTLLKDLTGLQILTLSFLLASIFLFFIILKQKKLNEFKKYKFKDYLIIFLLGSFGVFIYNMLNTYSYRFATGTEAVAINYLWPIWIILFSVIILKEQITIRKIIATLVSFLGMVLVVTRGNFSSFANTSILGVSLSLFGSICYGLFCVLVKKSKYDKTVSTMLFFFFSAIIGLICIFCFSSFPTLTLKISFWLLLRGIGQFALAYTLWAYALMGDTVKMANLALITPFLQLLSLIIFANEAINLIPLLGLIFIVSGILIARKSNIKFKN